MTGPDRIAVLEAQLANANAERDEALDRLEQTQDDRESYRREVLRLRSELIAAHRTVAELTARLAAVEAAIGGKR